MFLTLHSEKYKRKNTKIQPMFLLAMYERDGQPLEVIAKHFIESKFIRPKIRPYQTDNYSDVLKRAAQAEKEVDRIVSAVQRKKK